MNRVRVHSEVFKEFYLDELPDYERQNKILLGPRQLDLDELHHEFGRQFGYPPKADFIRSGPFEMNGEHEHYDREMRAYKERIKKIAPNPKIYDPFIRWLITEKGFTYLEIYD